MAAAGAAVAAEVGTSMVASAANLYSAERQMDFQREMASTKHHREVKDLRRAGLNPILSALKTGGGIPPGAQARIESPAKGLTALALQKQLNTAAIGKLRQETNTSSAMEGKLMEEGSLANEMWQSEQIKRLLNMYSLSEAKSIDQFYKTMGTGGKGLEKFLPLLKLILGK